MHRLPLVGRSTELGILRGALEEAGASRPRIVLVCGEPGMGKSRLTEEFAEVAARGGFRVAWGRAWESGGAPGFWPWIQVLRTLDDVSTSEVPAPELARLLPELGAAPSRGATPDERFALFDAVLRSMIGAANRQAQLVVLEDLHAADVASLELLAFVAAHLRDARVMLLGTYRDLEARRSAVRAEMLERVRRFSDIVSPRSLTLEHVAELARSGGVFLDHETVTRLYRAAQGNPLFVVEMLTTLQVSPPTDGRLPVPEGMRSLIGERLGALSGERGLVLEALATAGRECALPLLAEVCRLPMDHVSAELSAARETGIVVESAPERFSFSHGLFAEALRQDLPRPRRNELHLRIADSLERVHADAGTAPLAEIAHHLLEIGTAVAGRAIACARRAAERAMSELAFEQAAALLDRALAAHETALSADVGGRIELLLAGAHAKTLSGDLEGGQNACLSAASLARTLGAPELLARAALGYGAALTVGITDPRLVTLLEEALAALPEENSAWRARLLGRLAAALQPARDPKSPIALARRAIEIARGAADDRTRLEVFHVASGALAKHGPPEERKSIDLEALRLAEFFKEPSLSLRAQARLVFDHIELSDLDQALWHVNGYELVANALRSPKVRWPAPMFRAMFALYRGHFSEHGAHLAEARRWIEASGDETAAQCLEMHRIGTLRTLGDDAGLEGLFSSLWREPRDPYPSYDRALRWMILGRLGRTRELSGLLAAHDPQEIVRLGDPMLAYWVAESVHSVRDRAWAEPLYAWLAANPGQVALQAMHGMFVEGPTARALFLLADVLEHGDAARGHFQDALAQARRQGARPLETRLRYEWGISCLKRGSADDGRRSLEQAHSLAAALGMPFAQRVALALAASVPDGAAPPAHQVVTLAREGEYWTVSGIGETARLRHSRGLEMLARLLAEPGREITALELSGADGADGGDAGELLDREARNAYATRLREIETELAEAEQWNDRGRQERLNQEAEALKAELSRALGLGGRPRRSGSAAERARINAQRRLSDAIRRIQRSHGALGAHLARCVRTGAFCSYDPKRAGF